MRTFYNGFCVIIIFAGDFDGSDNECDESVTNDFGLRHWERDEIPMVVKTEKVNRNRFFFFWL